MSCSRSHQVFIHDAIQSIHARTTTTYAAAKGQVKADDFRSIDRKRQHIIMTANVTSELLNATLTSSHVASAPHQNPKLSRCSS
jgi:hypothetical protein